MIPEEQGVSQRAWRLWWQLSEAYYLLFVLMDSVGGNGNRKCDTGNLHTSPSVIQLVKLGWVGRRLAARGVQP